jgi:hypothetical protein
VAAALAVGRQIEPRRVAGQSEEEAVQRRGHGVDGARQRRVRVGERIAVAHGGGKQADAGAAQRDGVLVVELGPLAPPIARSLLLSYPACRRRRNEHAQPAVLQSAAVSTGVEQAQCGCVFLLRSHYGVRFGRRARGLMAQ